MLGGLNARSYYDLYMFFLYPTNSSIRSRNEAYVLLNNLNPELRLEKTVEDLQILPTLSSFWNLVNKAIIGKVHLLQPTNYDETYLYQRFAYNTTAIEQDERTKLFLLYLSMPPPTTNEPSAMERRGTPPIVFGAPRAKRTPVGKERDYAETDETPENTLTPFDVYFELCKKRGTQLYARVAAEVLKPEIDATTTTTTRVKPTLLTLFARLIVNYIQLARMVHPKSRQDRQPAQMRNLKIERMELRLLLAKELGVAPQYSVASSCTAQQNGR